jgi:hypothetical protein
MPRYFFMITNWSESESTSEQLLEHYLALGTFEDRLCEFNQAIGAHLSSQSFEENECTMFMALQTFNLAGIVRNEHEDTQGSCMDLGRFQSQVLKAGSLVIKHSRRVIVRVANGVQALWNKLSERFSGWKFSAQLKPLVGPNRRLLRPPATAILTEVLRP